jgi:hypothetical protein
MNACAALHALVGPLPTQCPTQAAGLPVRVLLLLLLLLFKRQAGRLPVVVG